jgi:hypothetical protein
LSAGEHRGWTLRVPVLPPRWVTLAAPAMRWMAAAAAVCALAWLGLPASLAMLLGLAAMAFAMAPQAAAACATRVSAVLFTSDHAMYVRLPLGWRPLSLRGVTRGWRCLALRGELSAPLRPRRAGLHSRQVAFTVWQDALPASAWRRLNMLSQRSVRRTPAHTGTGTVGAGTA